MLEAHKAHLVGVAVSLDRQEKVGDVSADNGDSGDDGDNGDSTEKVEEGQELSAIQSVQRDLGVPILSIVCLSHLVSYMEREREMGGMKGGGGGAADLEAIRKYRERYGVEYR